MNGSDIPTGSTRHAKDWNEILQRHVRRDLSDIGMVARPSWEEILKETSQEFMRHVITFGMSAGEVGHVMGVTSLCGEREATQLHVLYKPLSERCHRGP
jgi:hypothetical protein